MAHQASRWQIAVSGTSFDAATGFAATVFDDTDGTALEEYLDAGPLSSGDYEATVAHQSDTDDWSQFAEPEEFSINSPPTDPGTPTAAGSGPYDEEDTETFTWTASTDPDSDPVTYESRAVNADTLEIVAISTGLTSATDDLDMSTLTTGTWRFEVRATDGALFNEGGWIASAEFDVVNSFPDPNLRIGAITQTGGIAQIDTIAAADEVEFQTAAAADTGYASPLATQSSTAAERFFHSMPAIAVADTDLRTRVRYRIDAEWSDYFEVTWSTLAEVASPPTTAGGLSYTRPGYAEPVFGTTVTVSVTPPAGTTITLVEIRLGFSGAWTTLATKPANTFTFDSTAFADNEEGELYVLRFTFSNGSQAEHPGFVIANGFVPSYYDNAWLGIDPEWLAVGDTAATWSGGEPGIEGRIKAHPPNQHVHAGLVRGDLEIADEGRVAGTCRIHTFHGTFSWDAFNDAEGATTGIGMALKGTNAGGDTYGVIAKVSSGLFLGAFYPFFDCNTVGISSGLFTVEIRVNPSATDGQFTTSIPVAASYMNLALGPLRCTRFADYHLFLEVTKPDRVLFPNRIDIVARCVGPGVNVLIEETVDLAEPLACGWGGFMDGKIPTPNNKGWRSYLALNIQNYETGLCDYEPDQPPPVIIPPDTEIIPCAVLLDVYAEDRETVEWSVSDVRIISETIIADPHLLHPTDYAEQEVDVIASSASIGTVSFEIVDPARVAGNQDSGLMTYRLADGFGRGGLNGRRGRLRRFTGHEDVPWQTIMDGDITDARVPSYASGAGTIRDTRERERRMKAFARTGTTSMLPRGVAIPWGTSNPDWLSGTVVAMSDLVSLGGLQVSLFADYWSSDTVADPDVLVSQSTIEAMTTEVREATIVGGLLQFTLTWPNVEIWWLPQGEATTGTLADEWNKITFPQIILNPLAGATPDLIPTIAGDVFEDITVSGFGGQRAVRRVILGQGPNPLFPGLPFLDIPGNVLPEEGQQIDFMVVYVGPATENLPFHDGSEPIGSTPTGGAYFATTMGAFLTRLYDGEYGEPDVITGEPVPTGIRYDPDAVAAMTDVVLPRITEPWTDVRKGAEENVFAASRWLPTLDNDGRISPRLRTRPTSTEGLREINALCLVPENEAPGWDAGDAAVNVVKWTYRRYGFGAGPLQSTADRGTSRSSLDQRVADATEVGEVVPREPVDRIIAREVTQERYLNLPPGASSIDRFGEQEVEVDSEVIGTIGTISGGTVVPVSGATLEDEPGFTYGRDVSAALFERYGHKCPRITVKVLRDPVIDHTGAEVHPGTYDLIAGDWVVLDCSWIPNYETRLRGVRHYAQIVAIGDLDCATREATFEIVAPVEEEESLVGRTMESTWNVGSAATVELPSEWNVEE